MSSGLSVAVIVVTRRPLLAVIGTCTVLPARSGAKSMSYGVRKDAAITLVVAFAGVVQPTATWSPTAPSL
jgi:hypothetical protein